MNILTRHPFQEPRQIRRWSLLHRAIIPTSSTGVRQSPENNIRLSSEEFVFRVTLSIENKIRAYVERYFALALNIVKYVVQSWQELHVLVQTPGKLLVNLETTRQHLKLREYCIRKPTSGSSAPSRGLPTPSRMRYVGICSFP